jgi:hypothetical protein
MRAGGRMVDPLETLISEQPHFHIDAGKPANWAASPDVLRFIRACLKGSMRTLETGAGQSTVVFAMVGTHHVCITPQQDEAQRIRRYCREHGIEHDKITFIHESSDIALASAKDIPEVIDFVFIDGPHYFPFPIVDWHFAEKKVPIGGIVAIDDYLIPSVRILHDFLLGENEWELIQSFHSIRRRHTGTSFFRRKREPPTPYWHLCQKMNRLGYHPLRWLLQHPRGTLRTLVGIRDGNAPRGPRLS